MTIYKIHFLNSEKKINIIINCPSNKFILEAAEDNNIELPYSCRAGSCSTCLGKIKNGTVNQEDQIFLDKDQIENNYILTCVAYPTSDLIILTHEEENLN